MRGNGSKDGSQQASDRIFTVPNVISAVRLCLVPVFLVLLFEGHDLAATFLFALAAGTDWIDGQIARRTNAVSRLGQLLDPAVDRILMIAGVSGLFLTGRLPLWIILVVLAIDIRIARRRRLRAQALSRARGRRLPGQGGHDASVRRLRRSAFELAARAGPRRQHAI